MTDLGVAELKATLPLTNTLDAQRELSRVIQAKPLEEVFKPLAERTDVGFLSLYQRNYDEKGEKNPPPKYAKYFDPTAQDRKYYVLLWKDKKLHGKEREYLVVEEEAIGGNTDLKCITVFDTPESWVKFPYGGTERTVHYLSLERLYIVNKKTQKAVELASPWWDRSVDADPLVRVKNPKIGIFPGSERIQLENIKEFYEAIAETNTLLVTDERRMDTKAGNPELVKGMLRTVVPWLFTYAVGEEIAPPLTRWLAYSMAAAEATQKGRDLQIDPELVEKAFLHAGRFTTQESELAANFLSEQFKNALRVAVEKMKFQASRTARTVDTDKKQSLSQNLRRLFGKIGGVVAQRMISRPQEVISDPMLEKLALVALIRLKRNALAVTFRFLDHMKWQGFDLTGGMTAADYSNLRDKILRYYDVLYEEKMERFQLDGSFSSG